MEKAVNLQFALLRKSVFVIAFLFAVSWLLTLSALLTVSAARAEVLRDLYSANVAVADQSDAALEAAAKLALAEVVVKVSGSFEVLRRPGVREALDSARRQVQQYAYSRDTFSENALNVGIVFDGNWVTELVTQAGGPLWSANRPSVVAWVVLEGPQGRYFLNSETSPKEAAQLQQSFARRGVPLQLPLYDLADTQALSPDEVWRLDGSALRRGSARYAAAHILAGRAAIRSTGELLGDWSYFGQNDRVERTATAPDFAKFAAMGVGMVADDMAARYAIAPSTGEQGAVRMSVSGVFRYADYAGIVGWLESLEIIERANIERIAGDRLDLVLHARADAAQLAPLIELDKRLRPEPSAESLFSLRYSWHY